MRNKWRALRILWSLLGRYGWAIPAIVMLGIMSSLAEGIGISLFIPFLQNFDHSGQQTSGGWLARLLVRWFMPIPAEQRLRIICACIFGSALLKALLAYSNRVLVEWLNAHIGHHLRASIFEQLLTMSYRSLEQSQPGKLINVLTHETERANEALYLFVNVLIIGCTCLVPAGLLLLISWPLTLMIVGIMFVISILVRLLTRQAYALGRRETAANNVLADRLVECIKGMYVIRSFGRETYEQDKFDKMSAQVSKTRIKRKIVSESVVPIYEILVAAVLVAILLVGVMSNNLNGPGGLSAVLVFIFLLFRIQPKIVELDACRVRLVSQLGAVEAVQALIKPRDTPHMRVGSRPSQNLQDAIRFDRVTYHYGPEELPAVRQLSARIAAGKTTALVGPSGGGKSTLIKLLLRLYDVTEGEIYVDNTPLSELDMTSWRRRIAVVSQDVHIFNASVQENIAYGKPDASPAEIVAAAQQAEAHEFICELPHAYHTRIGDQGVRLSGGQQQRITLARAIVRNPEILILDEATNALDSISEHLIQKALDTVRKNRTVIVIAHRLSTIMQADHIMVMAQGRVQEEGNLQYLLSLDGLFTQLYSLQYGTAKGFSHE